MTATAAEVREWARETGLEVPGRGKVPATLQDQYDKAHVTRADAPPPPDGAQWREPGDDPGGQADDGAQPGGGRGKAAARERAPRRVGGGFKFSGLLGGGGKGKAKKKPAGRARGPRQDLGEFAADLWGDLALITQGLPPVSRVLRTQAPYAATVFDEAVKGVPLLDTVLQPVARYSVSLRAVNGLLGPPLFTMAICATGQFVHDGEGRMVAGPDGRPVPDMRTSMMLGSLRYSLMQMAKVGDIEKVAARAKEDEQRAAQVDALIDYIFGWGPPPPPGKPPSPPPPEDRGDGGAEALHPTRVFRYPAGAATAMDDTGARNVD